MAMVGYKVHLVINILETYMKLKNKFLLAIFLTTSLASTHCKAGFNISETFLISIANPLILRYLYNTNKVNLKSMVTTILLIDLITWINSDSKILGSPAIPIGNYIGAFLPTPF